jgi:hypothetical protein
MDAVATISELEWLCVPGRAVALAEKCAATTTEIRKAIQDLPTEGFLDLWYNSDEDKLLLNVGDWIESDDHEQWMSTLRPLASELQSEAEIGGPGVGGGDESDWVKIAFRSPVARLFCEKRGASPTLDAGMRLTGFKPGIIPGAPRPLAAGLASGILGAGLGYGAGWLGETLMPDKWKKGRLRRNLAIMGGLGGITLPALWALHNVNQGRGWNEPGPMANTDPYVAPETTRPYMDGKPNPNFTNPISYQGIPEMEDYVLGKTGMDKEAFNSMTGFNGPWVPISVPDFHATVNLDPRVRSRLDPATRAAATGLVHGASAMAGGAKLVSPLDVGRMAAGMGSGYLSGMVVGKVLGGLMGASPPAQEKLKNTGLWAGAIANVVPLAFGR